MQRIERWFTTAAKRQNRVTALYPSLLCNRLLPYLAYRLRFLVTLQVIAFAVHVAEFLILLAHAPKLAVIVVVLLRAGSPLVRGAWWGGMEVMRERLRDLSGPGAKDRAEQEISNWFFLSVMVATLVLLAGFAWIVWALIQPGSTSATIVHVYMALIVIELAMRLPVLTLHSGIYATRRIYRPFFSILLPTLLQGAVIATLFSVFKEGALIVAILVSSGSSLIINYIYIKRMYRIAGLRLWLPWRGRQFFRFLTGLPPLNLMWSTAAGFLIRIDSLLVLFLVGLESFGGHTIDLTAGHPDWNTPDLGVLLYLILPAIRGSYEWSVLFYFDFVRLRRAVVLRDLARVFMTKLALAAIAVGLLFWGMAGVVFVIGFRDIPLTFLFAMLPFFLLRSWLAVYQVRAFADGRFAIVCLSMGLIIACVILIGTGGYADIGSFVELKICLLAAVLFLMTAQFFYDRRHVAEAPFLSLADWCRKLTREPTAVTAGSLDLARGASDKHKSGIRQMVEEHLGQQGHCAWRDEDCLVYYQRFDRQEKNNIDPLAILEAAAGMVARMRPVLDRSDNGQDALLQLRAHGLIADPPEEKVDTQKLLDTFNTLFADAPLADMKVAKRADLKSQLGRDTAASAIPLALRAYRSGANFIWCGDHRIYPIFLDQKLRAIFFVPKGAKSRALDDWHRALQMWSLCQSEDNVGRHGRST